MPFVHLHSPNSAPDASDVCLVIQGGRMLARVAGGNAVVLPGYAQVAGWIGNPAEPLHVGRLDGRPVWLHGLPEGETGAPEGWEWQETRALLSLFTPGQSHAVSCARQLLWWDQRNRFCGACGAPTVDVEAERAKRCPKCGSLFFPVASAAVIVAVTRGDEILLAHNRNFRPGLFALLAGFVDPGETLEQAVAREVREEVGIEIGGISYVASQPWSFPNSLMVGFRAEWRGGEIAVDGKEIEAAAWYRRTAMPETPGPGTVARMIIDRWLAE